MISQPLHNCVLLLVLSHKVFEFIVLSLSLIKKGQGILLCLLSNVVDVVGSPKVIMERQHCLYTITARSGDFYLWPGLCFHDKWGYNIP